MAGERREKAIVDVATVVGGGTSFTTIGCIGLAWICPLPNRRLRVWFRRLGRNIETVNKDFS